MLMNTATNVYECFSGSNNIGKNKVLNDKQFSNQIGNLDITENDSHNGEQINQNAETYNDNMFYFNNAA